MANVVLECDMHVYDIKKCGLYIGRPDAPEHLGTKDLLKALKFWAIDSNKPLVETSTYSADGNYLEAYCLGLSEFKGNYLLALWNKIPSSKSGVGMVNGSSSPKNAKVTQSKKGAADIPGYPTYFWILPGSNKLVALKLTNESFGVTQARAYLTGYLQFFSPHALRKGGKIKGYTDKPIDKKSDEEQIVNNNLAARFTLAVTKIPGKYEEIIKNNQQVTKLVKEIDVYDDQNDINARVSEQVRGWFNNLKPADKKKMRVHMPISVTKADIRDLIRKYEDSDQSNEHDIGFVFKGKSSHIEWLRGANHREKAKIKVEYLGENQPNLDKLVKELHKHTNLVING